MACDVCGLVRVVCCSLWCLLGVVCSSVRCLRCVVPCYALYVLRCVLFVCCSVFRLFVVGRWIVSVGCCCVLNYVRCQLRDASG